MDFGSDLTEFAVFVFLIALQEWKDDRLEWDASAKDDIKIVYADPSTIWHPELIVDNS